MTDTIIAWIGTTTSVIGAFLVAFGIFGFGYVMFLCGSISWLIVATLRKDSALAALNATFLIANIIGLVRYIGA